jgi:gliding motility-associated-like protein
MNKLFLAASLLIALRNVAQCPYTATLTSTGNCPGAVLTVNGTTSPIQIVWYDNGALVSLVTATSSPTIVTVAGGNGPGPAANQLNRAFGVCVDASGNVYVADRDNNRVQKWAPGATTGITVAGGNGPGTASNQLNFPMALFVDGSGNIYVADNASRVQKWAPGATSGMTVAGGIGYGSGPAQLNNPADIYVDGNGNLYIADLSNQRIQEWAPGASSGITVAGGNGNGAAANQFSDPAGVTMDAGGNLYVSDQTNNRVQRWAPGATSGITVAGGNGAGSAANQFYSPCGIRIDNSGNLYVADFANNRVQLWAPGASSGVTVAGGNGFGSAANQLEETSYLFVDAAGNIYVSDEYNFRVQEYTLTNIIINSFTAATAGTYTAALTDKAGCSVTSNPIVINPIVTPSISITASTTTICSGTPVTFTALPVNGGTGPDFSWTVNGTIVSAGTGSYTSNSLQNGDQVSCVLTSDALCSTTATATSNVIPLSVKASPIYSVSVIASATSVCSGSAVNFEANTTGSGAIPVYQWQVNGVDAGTDSPDYTDSHPVNGDLVTCQVSGDNSCPAAVSNPITLTVNPTPVVEPGQVFTVQQSQSLTLNPVVSGAIFSYSWSPATGLSDTNIRDPVADPAATTVYQLQVTTAAGCAATGDITVKVFTQLSIPNAFTPNGDGKNDIFYVLGGPAGSLIRDFAIFNRWGQRIFEVHDVPPGDPAYGWNGYYQGSAAISGVYVYILDVRFAGGTSQVFKGTVMLVR